MDELFEIMRDATERVNAIGKDFDKGIITGEEGALLIRDVDNQVRGARMLAKALGIIDKEEIWKD